MSEQRKQTISAGPGYTDIVATIPLHYLKVWPDGDRNVAALNYKTPDDSFTAVFTTDASMGDIIERLGPGRHGLLGHPAAFSASGQTATVLLQVKFADDVSRDVIVFESETNL